MQKSCHVSSMFPFPNRLQYLPGFIYPSENSQLVTLSSQLILFILLHIHVPKASNLLLSVWVNVCVSAAYSATLQTKHFIILSFSSRLILPIKQFLFLHKYFLCYLSSALNVFGNIPPQILSYLNI